MEELIEKILEKYHLSSSRLMCKLLNNCIKKEDGYFLDSEIYNYYQKYITTDYEDLSDDDKKDLSLNSEGVISLLKNHLDGLIEPSGTCNPRFKIQKLGELLLSYKKSIIKDFIGGIQMDSKSEMKVSDTTSQDYFAFIGKEFEIDRADTDELMFIDKIIEIATL